MSASVYRRRRPARKAASSASSMRSWARLRARGRAMSCNKLRASCEMCKCLRARAPSSPLATLAARWDSGSGSRRSPRAASGPCRERRAAAAERRFPGKLLWKLDPGAVDALAARLPAGVVARLGDERQDDDERRWRRGSWASDHRLAWNRAGANLLSGIASALVSARRSRARALRGRRGRASGGHRAHAAARRSRSRTSSATSSTATASSRSSPSAGAPRSIAFRTRRRSSSTRDDPVVAEPRGRT